MTLFDDCVATAKREATDEQNGRERLLSWLLFWTMALIGIGAVIVILWILATPLGAEAPPHVFLAVSGDPPSQQLYVDRLPSLPPLRLSCEMPTAGGIGNVFGFALAPNGQRVIYSADATRDQIYDLWSVAITGGACTMISNRYDWGHRDFDVRSGVTVSPDSTRAVYSWGWSSGGLWELWSAPIATANGYVRISQPGAGGRGVQDGWTFRGDLVRYSSDIEVDETYAWYVVPIGGGRILRELFCDGFERGNTGEWS